MAATNREPTEGGRAGELRPWVEGTGTRFVNIDPKMPPNVPITLPMEAWIPWRGPVFWEPIPTIWGVF